MPGLIYFFQSEKRRSAPRRSVFRETSTVIVSSAIFLGIPLVGWALLSYPFPSLRSALSASLTNFTTQFANAPIEYFLWTVVYLLGASLLAFLAATVKIQKLLTKLAGRGSIETRHSGWTFVFDEKDPSHVLVASIQLKSGTWVQGNVASYSPTVEENDQRSIILSGSITLRTSTSCELTYIEDGQQMVIQASQIEYLIVTYLEPDQDQPG